MRECGAWSHQNSEEMGLLQKLANFSPKQSQECMQNQIVISLNEFDSNVCSLI